MSSEQQHHRSLLRDLFFYQSGETSQDPKQIEGVMGRSELVTVEKERNVGASLVKAQLSGSYFGLIR